MTLQIKATEQYFNVVLFIMLYKVALSFESVDEILKCDHSNKSDVLSSTFLWCCLLCCTRWFYRLSLLMKSQCVTIQIKATEQYFPVVLFIMLHKVVLAVESVNEILKCGNSTQSY